jgi:DNA-binding transcriptional LysR family regulator
MRPVSSRLVNLDIDQVRAFVTIAEVRNFTRAGALLGRSQSAVSLQLKRLEERLGVSLLLRDPRRVSLTHDGEAMLPQAVRLIRCNDEMLAGLGSSALEGEVRLGAPEDFATLHLPGVLGRFAQAHPKVRLNVTCDLTLNLIEALNQGSLDMALIKREPIGPDVGIRVWREPLVWVAAAPKIIRAGDVLPLIVAPSPCVYRRRAIAALETGGLGWRIAYTSPSLAGQHAALRAGLGVTVLPREMVPQDLHVIGAGDGLPHLADTEIALLRAKGAGSRAVGRLWDMVLSALTPRAV